MSFFIDKTDNTFHKLRKSYKSNFTNIILSVNNDVLTLQNVKTHENSYNLKIFEYPDQSKIKLIKIVKVLTNADIITIKEELNNLPLLISSVRFKDIFKIEMLLNNIEVKFVIT